MLKYITGNLLDSKAEALVNTVNTVGVMGKGIALQFKEAFRNNLKKYLDACKAKELQPGKLLVVRDQNALLGEKIIINFPTKTHWRQPSRYEYIEAGLIELSKVIKDEKIKSIAIPPLGCGNGGLEWDRVKSQIEKYLSNVDAEVFIYQPNSEVKAILQKENTKKDAKLTPARAQLLYLLFYYESLGEYSSLFSANKLAFVLQTLGEDLRLKFIKHHYGPYSHQIGHVLYALNGIYITGLEQKEAKPFEPLMLNYKKLNEVQEYVNKELSFEQKERLKNSIKLIDGFQSELSLEILASVAYILLENPSLSNEEVFNEVTWTDRKKKLFKKSYVDIAYRHLHDYSKTSDILLK
ncbi:phosphatase [Niastella vici]|uniref:Phosphatase n=1 Tax=Niastella vici TaxID=1703345 RepID=A0A1V9G5U5_9BACT|nr:macro domain-containing protein [Niastella vici]OQP65836.1 phosphatase [Niastella vici]